MRKIKKDDEVIVITGKDKGKRGKVTRIIPAKNRAYVEGINLIKKHVKANPRSGEAGGIITREASIDISNLAIYNPITKKADRVKIKVVKNADNTEKKVRYFKSTDELIDI